MTVNGRAGQGRTGQSRAEQDRAVVMACACDGYQLLCEDWYVMYNREANTPFFVHCKLNNRW